MTLPRWDTAYLYPALGSREYESAREGIDAALTRLEALYDQHDVRGGDRPVDDDALKAFDEVLAATNETHDLLRPMRAFVYAHATTDALDDLTGREYAAVQFEDARLRRLSTRLEAWIAALGPDALAARSPVAAEHRYPLERAARRAAHQMTEAEESLYAELSLTGSSAWASLHRQVTASLTVEVDGEVRPMSEVRGLAGHPDRAVRRAAYEAELSGWESVDATLAACLNGVKGEFAVVDGRRGFADALEPALANNAVDRPTLDALQEAVVDSLPAFRRYLKAKARRVAGADRLPWFDLFAPVGADDACAWPDAADAVRAAFGSYSPALAGLADRAFAERWVDAEPRRGKRDGAFCLPVQGDRSLVLMNFTGRARDVSTLAHELGHAYHNVALAERTALQRHLPMALAETASIFCETVLVDHALRAAGSAEQRLAVLEDDLQNACQLVVDIHSRFLFERAMTGLRANRLVPARELCGLMLDAQEQAYGDGLDPAVRHPYMWAVKPHYYGQPFYNWPYTFGYLFGVGLFAQYQADPDRFRAEYDGLLSSTGMGTAADLAAGFGIDVRDPAFWAAGLAVVAGRVDEFAGLVGG